MLRRIAGRLWEWLPAAVASGALAVACLGCGYLVGKAGEPAPPECDRAFRQLAEQWREERALRLEAMATVGRLLAERDEALRRARLAEGERIPATDLPAVPLDD